MNSKLISTEENRAMEKIDSIDFKKEVIHIFQDPEKFFDPYMKDIKTPLAIIFAKLSILRTLKKIDSSEELADITMNYFLNKYSIKKWLDILSNFYRYILSSSNYIIEHYDNDMLDLYNEKIIDKTLMEKGMQVFANTKKRILAEIADTTRYINEIEEEKQRVSSYDQFGGLEELGDID